MNQQIFSLQKLVNILDCLDEDDTSPPGLGGDCPAQAHLDEQLGEFEHLKQTGCPFVAAVLLAPCSCVASVGRGGQQGFAPWIGAGEFGQYGVVIDTHNIEQSRDCTEDINRYIERH